VYDRFGNRLQQTNYTGTCMTPNYTLQTGKYWISGFSYDLAGDMIGDGIHSYQYDAEGRLASVDSGSTASYVYDAGGTRVRRIVGGVAYDDVYDLGGHVISDFLASGGTWNRGEVYAGGMHLATYIPSTANTYFVHSDWLGTERVRSGAGGAIYSTWTSYPFGEGSLTSNPSPAHFTGKERDSESGNDYFGARYYASSMGRWLMPDPSGLSYSDPRDPQSLNLYAYVGNHALQYVDPYGLNWFNQAPCSGTYYAQTSLGTAIKSFFAHLFANCGGSGGGGSDPDPFPDTGRPITKRPFRQPLSQMDVSERLYDVKQNLSKPCKKAYSGVGKRLGVPFSMSTFARSLENGELDQHPNEEPQGNSADATTDASGARTIHTWANFYGLSSSTQGFALWHELTHKNFKIGDDESNAPGPGLDFNNQFAPYGYRGDYGGGGTADFTDWLEGGCPAQ
jgi:RHS repeat-associated protein